MQYHCLQGTYAARGVEYTRSAHDIVEKAIIKIDKLKYFNVKKNLFKRFMRPLKEAGSLRV